MKAPGEEVCGKLARGT